MPLSSPHGGCRPRCRCLRPSRTKHPGHQALSMARGESLSDMAERGCTASAARAVPASEYRLPIGQLAEEVCF